MERLSSVILHPFAKGALVDGGIQYSALHTTTTDDYEAVETEKIEVPMPASHGSEPIVEVEFGLTCSIQSSGAAEDVLFKWQASEDLAFTSPVDLNTEITYAANASVLKEYTVGGRFEVEADFNVVPFWLRLVIKSSGAGGETAKGKTKNSSYLRIIYSDA